VENWLGRLIRLARASGIPSPILVAWKGTLWHGSIGRARGNEHFFGGRLELLVHGFPKKERPLQRLLTLNVAHAPLNARIPNISMLPLVYGFNFDGCQLKYQLVSDREVRMVEMCPKTSLKNWPYRGYPKHFSVKPVVLGSPEKLSRKRLTQLTWQGLGISAAKQLVVVVCPSDDYQVALWGEYGDMVEVIFRVDPASGLVTAISECD